MGAIDSQHEKESPIFLLIFLFLVFLLFLHSYIAMIVGGVVLTRVIEIVLFVIFITILVFSFSTAHKDE
ncbi:hypothetical protein KAOT1_16108 [Kordia algicida OT-1]|uniref:Uncharacterized protein n=1 Tax=Kordia algicida OT-1 TaxID=391587 RepID=A9DQV9_9FLAO|nr:hypothetical protein KAOT1_16108 [Kordia algicida OT-1]